MSEKVIGADTSRYATGNLTVPTSMLEHLRATKKVELFIPGAWHGAEGYDSVGPSLRNARNLGMRSATYVAHTQRGHGADDVLQAYQRIGETEWRSLSFVALDMEWGTPGTNPAVANMDDLLAGIDKCLTLNARPCLYTAAWWWKGHFGNPNIPVGLPVWNAFYDNDPDYDFASYPYGGPGVKLIGEQHTNSTSISAPGGPSMSFDFNAFEKDWIDAFPVTTPNGLALLAKAWQDDMADTIKQAAALHAGGINPVALALFGFRQQDKAQAWAKLIGGPK